MKGILVPLCTMVGLALGTHSSLAAGNSLPNGGEQPWWNIFAKSNKCLTPEEERLQKFWHDYYDAMGRYYGALDHIDWVAYYKNHGYEINGQCPCPGCCKRINYAPVFVSPTMQWEMSNTSAGGPSAGPSGGR